MPERELWLAVINRAVMDATIVPGGKADEIREARMWRSQARTWLNGNTADFREVCTLAGLEPEYVQRKHAGV